MSDDAHDLRRCTDYWDSFWIVEGLLKSELYDIVNSTLQNFMDEIETLGFIPNGGRIYCKPFSLLLAPQSLVQVAVTKRSIRSQ